MAHSIVAGVASNCYLPVEAQRVVADRQDLVAALAANEHVVLDREVWLRMYTIKPLPAASITELLVYRVLDHEQIMHVLTHEKRVRTVETMLEMNRLTADQITYGLAQKKTASVIAKTLVSQGILFDASFAEELRAQIAALAGPDASLAWLDSAANTSQDEVAGMLGSENFLHPNRTRRDDRPIIARLVERYPDLLALCVRENVSASLFQIACGSRLLVSDELQGAVLTTAATHPDTRGVEFALLALVNNPVCRKETIEEVIAASFASEKVRESANRRLKAYDTKPTVEVPYREVEDAATLEWLVRRACSFNSRYGDYTPPKPFEVAELCFNPHLTAEHKERLGSDLYSTYVQDVIGMESFLASFEALHKSTYDPHGTNPTVEQKYTVREPHRLRGLYPIASDADLEHGANVAARMLQNNFRLSCHSYVENLTLSTEQWRLFLELLDVMPDAVISEIAAVALVS